MSSPLAIREALAAYLPTVIEGLRAGTDPGTLANPPVALILPANGLYIDYTAALNPLVYDVTIRIIILVSRASEREGFEQLDNYLIPYGATSVPAAILANQRLSGACDYIVPVQANGPLPMSFAGIDYYGAEIICKAAGE